MDEADAHSTRARTASSPHEGFLARRTFTSLDGLRCLAILAVVWCHASNGEDILRHFPAARIGYLGVDLFFVISGFLIVTLLLRERDRTGRISLARFYARRSLRIFPLYYAVLALFALAYVYVWPNAEGAANFRADWPALVFYLTNWMPAFGLLELTWSLAAEEQFYLVWPTIEAKAARWALASAILLIVVSELIRMGFLDAALRAWFGGHQPALPMLRGPTFTPILLGVLLAHLAHTCVGFECLARLGCTARYAAPVWLLAIIVVCNLLQGDVRGLCRPVLHLMFFFLVASCVLRDDHGLRRMLAWRPVARIGELSYGIYLLHVVALMLVTRALVPLKLDHGVLRFALGLLVAYVLAECSYRWLETPFLKLKGRFAA